MANTKQITATIPISLAEWIDRLPERGMVSFSKTIEILLQEAKEHREAGYRPKPKKIRYIK